MTFILIITCFFTPINIAFSYHKHGIWMDIVNYLIDMFYLFDIFVIFNTVIYDQEENMIENRKTIAINYVSGWFVIDFLSIIPFSLILSGESSRYNNLARVARVGRLYKLVKLTKLVRSLTVMKDQNTSSKSINDYLNIKSGYDRLIFFVLIFVLLCHIATCLWVVTASING